MKSKLQLIADKCKASVSLDYRSQSSYYNKLTDELKTDGDGNGEYFHASNFLDAEDLNKCVETDQYWCLHFYPNSPVGFHHAFSHDLEKLLDWALDILKDES